MDLFDAEEPGALGLQGVDFDEIGMGEHLGDAELVLGLLEEFVLFLGLDGHNLKRVLLAVEPGVLDGARVVLVEVELLGVEACGFSTTCPVAMIDRDAARAWTRAAMLTV